LGDHSLFDVADHALALGRDGIDLVDEDDAGGLLGGLVENLAEMSLALAVKFVDDFRAVDREELGIGLMCHGTRDQGLAAAWRAVQEDALGRVDAQAFKDFRITQR
jgi:hypothetical protein